MNEFSTMSKQQVASHLSANTSCVSEVQCEVSGGDSGGGSDGGGTTGGGDGGFGNSDSYSISAKYKNNYRWGFISKTILDVRKNGRKARRSDVAIVCSSGSDTLRTNYRGKLKITANMAEVRGVGGEEACVASIGDASVYINMPGEAYAEGDDEYGDSY